MNKFTLNIDGEQKLLANMRSVGASARPRVKRALQFLGLGLVQHIQKTKLQGQRLNQRTGRLISSIHEETTETGTVIITKVGTNVVYAPPHEFGFSGSSEVKAHVRTIKQAFGRPISPTVVQVRAHTRIGNTSEKRFFRDSLIEYRPTVERILTKLANDIIKDSVGQ